MKMQRMVYLQHESGIIAGSPFLGVMVTKEDLTEWCLGLSMLYAGVVDMFTLAEPQRDPYLNIRMDRIFSPVDRGAACLDNGIFHLRIGEHELLYWMTYYLSYARDGMVGADHIDCDVPLDVNDTSVRFHLTLKAADIAPPLSQDEARRLLGMD